MSLSPHEAALLERVARSRDGYRVRYDHLPDSEKLVARELRRRELIFVNSLLDEDFYRLTPAGESALASFNEACDKARHDQAQKRAEDAAKRESDRAQVLADKKRDYRHDFKVAAFTVVLTLLVEHFGKIIDFVKFLIGKAR